MAQRESIHPAGEHQRTPKPDREPPGPADAVAFAILTLVGLCIAIVATTVVDPTAADGAWTMVAIIAVPATVVAGAIQILTYRLSLNRSTSKSVWLWPFAVLPVVLMAVMWFAVRGTPDYYADGGSVLGAWAMMLLPLLMGMLLGPIVWFFVLFPLGFLISALVGRLRGDKGDSVLVPLIWLGITACILLLTFGGDFAGRRPGIFALIPALTGLPLGYEVQVPWMLWVVRGFALLCIGLAVWGWLRRRAVARAAGADS